MMIKLIYFLFIFLLMGCERTNNVSKSKTIGYNGTPILEKEVDGHDYINISSGYSHSGTCKKCKQERDSIVTIIIETIKENKADTK